MRQLIKVSATVLVVALFSACGGGGKTTGQPAGQPPPPQTVSLTIGPANLPNATKGLFYDFHSFTAQGGTPPYTYSVTTGLPAGLNFTNSLNPNTGFLQGTPVNDGSFTFTVNVSDGANHSGSKSYTLIVDTQLGIATTSLPTAVQTLAYNQPVVAVNGVAPLTWALLSGPSPNQLGLTFDTSSGRFQGVVSSGGSWNFDVQVTDSSSPARTVHKAVSLQIVQPLTFTGSSMIFRRGQFSGENIGLIGGVTPVSLQMTGGALPPGLVFTGAGVAGTPTQLGTFPATFLATDSYAGGPEVVSQNYTIKVLERLPTIINKELPLAVVGKPYDVYLAVDGGSYPLTWDPMSLPSGLAFDTAQGRITGTPTTSGTFGGFVFRVFDSSSPVQAATRVFNLTIAASARGRNDSIATASPLSNGGVFASLSPYVNAQGIEAPDTDYYVVTANGGATVTVSVIADTPPAGTFFSLMDPILEIVNAAGQRLTTCRNQGSDDGLTGAPDPTPNAFDDACLNDDIILGQNLNSFLELRVPAGAPQTFYIHVADFTGNARPDMRYNIQLSGVN
jgi:large repetitive protein